LNGLPIYYWPPKPGIDGKEGIPGIPLDGGPKPFGIPAPAPNPVGIPKPEDIPIPGMLGIPPIAPPGPLPDEELNEDEDELNELLDASPFLPWRTTLEDF